MALARKRSRKITVDGVVFRWRVGRTGGLQDLDAVPPAEGWQPLGFVAELSEGGGAKLVVNLRDARLSARWLWMIVPGDAVTPGVVAASIRSAIVAGWHPDRPGPAFLVVAGELPVERVSTDEITWPVPG